MSAAGEAAGRQGTWMAFLAMTFAVVGLMGLFATFAAPLPLQRALARDAALDAALAAGAGPDAAATIEQLQDRLGDSAAALLPVSSDEADRIARERTAMHARLLHEAEAEARQLRLLIVVVTAMCAVFGIVIMRFSGR